MRIVPTVLGTAMVALVALIAATAAPIHAAARSYTYDDNGNATNGRKVFLRENCYTCHGGRGGGGMCPSLRENPPDESDVRHAVEDGTPSGMPSFAGRVSRQEMADLAAYFQSFRSVREPTFTHWWEPGTPTR
jgi:mono/diheme cytochrome c family protein